MKYQSPKNQKSQRPPPPRLLSFSLPRPPFSFSVPPVLTYVIATPNFAQHYFPPLFLCTQGLLFCKPYLVKYSQSFLVFKKLNKFFCNILPLPNIQCSSFKEFKSTIENVLVTPTIEVIFDSLKLGLQKPKLLLQHFHVVVILRMGVDMKRCYMTKLASYH